MARVCVAIGSNLGDRRGHLDWAVKALGAGLVDLAVSPVFDTEAVDVPDKQPRYLNAVAVGRTEMSARDLLRWLLELEQARGRVRHGTRAARTLDLDLILYGDSTIREPGLVVPHPAFRSREFVLKPLAAIAPDWLDPVTGKSIAELLRELQTGPGDPENKKSAASP
jgi:2-amino-4-hydroxy-6-hydroxymethyldihydropteridine diphosphokinase